MIEYRFSEERDIVFFYSGKLSDYRAAKIFANELELNADEALYISDFFWKMVDCSIKCTEANNYPWGDGAEFWNEKILTSISGSLERLGFIDIWDSVVDRQ